MQRDSLFARTVEDLASTIDDENPDEYRILRSSALLRELLLDDDPLVHQVNRQRRKRIRFEARAEGEYERVIFEDKPMFWAFMEGISPRLGLFPQFTVESLTLDRWLAKRAAFVGGEDVTVKDLILQAAHVSGGVHAGTAKTEMQKRLAELNDGWTVGGIAGATRTLLGIGDVVVHALTPLCAPERTA